MIIGSLLHYGYSVEKSRRIFMENKQEVLSTVRIEQAKDLYKVVDCLNRTLKDQDLIFGLSLDEEDDDKMVFTIYRT